MANNPQEEQLTLLPSPELARSLAVISACSRILEAHSEAFHGRLVRWGKRALLKDGRSPGWVNACGGWWEMRQFLPEPALHALARRLEEEVERLSVPIEPKPDTGLLVLALHLRTQAQRISEVRRENADAPIDHT
jgi:hypothetical protein